MAAPLGLLGNAEAVSLDRKIEVLAVSSAVAEGQGLRVGPDHVLTIDVGAYRARDFALRSAHASSEGCQHMFRTKSVRIGAVQDSLG